MSMSRENDSLGVESLREFEKTQRESVVAILKELIAIPSFIDPDRPSQNENLVVDFIEKWVQENTAFITERQELPGGRFNLLVKNGEPQTLFLAHTDTVPPSNNAQFDQLIPTELDGELWGRGATDMKSGIASLMVTLLNPAAQEKNFWMLFYADEEYDFLGMREFVEKYSELKPSLIVSADESDLKIGMGCRGLIELVARIRGKAGHPGKGNGKSATQGMMSALLSLEEKLAQYAHPVMGNSVLNTAYMLGGQTLPDSYHENILVRVGKRANVVPDICEAVIELRPAQLELDAEVVVAHLKNECERMGLQLELVEIRHDLGSMFTDPEMIPFIQDIYEKGFTEFADVKTTGYLDMQMVWEALGFPLGIMFGSGIGSTAHTNEERISIRDLQTGLSFFNTVIESIE